MSKAVTPSEVPHFLLLGPLGLLRMDLLGVCCVVAGASFSAVDPSPMITAMISSRCFVSVGVRVTLVTIAYNSALMSSASSSNAEGLITFSLPFREKTGMGGSSAGSSFSSLMMCFFLNLEDILFWGSLSSFSGSSSAFVSELSVVDLTTSASGWSD